MYPITTPNGLPIHFPYPQNLIKPKFSKKSNQKTDYFTPEQRFVRLKLYIADIKQKSGFKNH